MIFRFYFIIYCVQLTDLAPVLLGGYHPLNHSVVSPNSLTRRVHVHHIHLSYGFVFGCNMADSFAVRFADDAESRHMYEPESHHHLDYGRVPPETAFRKDQVQALETRAACRHVRLPSVHRDRRKPERVIGVNESRRVYADFERSGGFKDNPIETRPSSSSTTKRSFRIINEPSPRRRVCVPISAIERIRRALFNPTLSELKPHIVLDENNQTTYNWFLVE